MRTSIWLSTLALLAGPALAQAPPVTTTPTPAQSGATPPPAAAPQTSGGQVMSQSPSSGATSTLPTDKGTGAGNSGNKQ